MTTERERLLNIAQNCANTRLRRSARSVSEFYNAVLAPCGLHANQVTLLIPPSLKDGLTINRLAALVDLDRTTLARNLKLLEAKGLVELRPGKDQRTRGVYLTDAGRETLLIALPLWEQAQAQLVGQFGEAPLQQLFGSLDTLVQVVQLEKGAF